MVLCLGLGACSGEPSGRVVDDAALADLTEGHDWLAFGRTYHEQRHSPLSQVNDSNVSRLGVAWYMDLPNDRTLYGTPLVVDGVMYFEGSYNVLRAVDAATGKLLWEFDPEVTKHAANRLLRNVGREPLGRVLERQGVRRDGRRAFDRRGRRDGQGSLEYDDGRSCPAALHHWGAEGIPWTCGDRQWRDGGRADPRLPRRGTTPSRGERVWRWYTVPGNPADGFENEAMKMAATTWTGEWWRYGGGGNVWHAITYDPDFDQLIFGTGNGAPWNRKIRSPGGGDNLFLCSVVALDATTGEYRWHYQTVPGETWDYNSNMDIVLADLKIDGRPVKAPMHAPKNGFFYVLNRDNGKLVSAEPFANVTWATGIDSTGRPIEVAGARYEDGTQSSRPVPWAATVGMPCRTIREPGSCTSRPWSSPAGTATRRWTSRTGRAPIGASTPVRTR